MIDIKALQAPFAPSEHSWRAQQVARDGRRAQALCYITSRAVQTRLDDVCSPAGWESSFTETPAGRVIATITIDIGGRWVSKSDGAGATAMEGEKGGLSGAFKRAAVMWGIGRYLYALPAVWAECEVARDQAGTIVLRNGKPTWRRWTPEGISQLEDTLNRMFKRMDGTPVEPHRVAGRRAQAMLPSPVTAGEPVSLAPPFKQPREVTALLAGLPQAMKDGMAEQFWHERFRTVPDIWRPFVVAERDRLKGDAGL